MFTLSKKERISSKILIQKILSGQDSFFSFPFKIFFLAENQLDYNRIMISVPKKRFKKAVNRNLIKRRIRESYRILKTLPEYKLNHNGFDIVVIYLANEILSYPDINKYLTDALTKIYNYSKKDSISTPDNID